MFGTTRTAVHDPIVPIPPPFVFFLNLQLRDHAWLLLSRQSKSMKALESPLKSPPIAVSSQTLKRPLNLS
jgi:hypothetical protein